MKFYLFFIFLFSSYYCYYYYLSFKSCSQTQPFQLTMHPAEGEGFRKERLKAQRVCVESTSQLLNGELVFVCPLNRDPKDPPGIREQTDHEDVLVPVCELLLVLLLRGLLQGEVCGSPWKLHIYVWQGEQTKERRGTDTQGKVVSSFLST